MTAQPSLKPVTSATPAPLPALVYEPILRQALAEDMGRGGDLTSQLTIPAGTQASANFVARESGTIAGLSMALRAFSLLDESLALTPYVQDGDRVTPGTLLATVSGDARSILGAERTALNLLGRLCGIATTTSTMVALLGGTHAKLADTRKTTLGLRALEKYAVRCGGGHNHRMALDDAIMIKDNHIAIAGSLTKAVTAAVAGAGHMVRIEVEVDTLQQLAELLTLDGVDVVLLDNMTPAQLKEAVAMVNGRLITEASGGVRPETLAAIAATGVDYISAGFLTHSAPNFDVGLDISL